MLTPELLKKFTPLHNLDDEQLERVARRIDVEEIPKGGVVCNENGTDNDSIYLLEGGLELRMQGSSMTRTLLAGAPDSFLPVAAGRPRPYTVIATSPAKVFRIDNSSLDRAVLLDVISTTITSVHDSGEAFAGDSEWMQEMMKNPAFRLLPKERLGLLLLKFEPRPVKAGEVVIKQGDPGDYYYVVKEGRLAVSQKDAQGKVRLLTELNRGSVFGEDALLLDEPRNASIVALSDSIVMRLPRPQFDDLLKNPLLHYVNASEAQTMLKAGAGLLDVRPEREYMQGSLKGSSNVPVKLLRARLRELDPKCSYVLICRNGTQSEAAAFMMLQRGYRVSVLRGGMQSIAR